MIFSVRDDCGLDHDLGSGGAERRSEFVCILKEILCWVRSEMQEKEKSHG